MASETRWKGSVELERRRRRPDDTVTLEMLKDDLFPSGLSLPWGFIQFPTVAVFIKIKYQALTRGRVWARRIPN